MGGEGEGSVVVARTTRISFRGYAMSHVCMCTAAPHGASRAGRESIQREAAPGRRDRATKRTTSSTARTHHTNCPEPTQPQAAAFYSEEGKTSPRPPSSCLRPLRRCPL